MSNLAVQNYNTENRANILHYAITGGLAGFAAKYAVPVTKKENEIYNPRKEIYHSAKDLIKKETDVFILAINDDAAKGDQASKIFSNIFAETKNPKKILNSPEFKAAADDIKNNIKTLVSQYKIITENGLKAAEKVYGHCIKNLRSTCVWCTVGALAGATMALAKNALDQNGERIAQEQAIIDAEEEEEI